MNDYCANCEYAMKKGKEIMYLEDLK